MSCSAKVKLSQGLLKALETGDFVWQGQGTQTSNGKVTGWGIFSHIGEHPLNLSLNTITNPLALTMIAISSGTTNRSTKGWSMNWSFAISHWSTIIKPMTYDRSAKQSYFIIHTFYQITDSQCRRSVLLIHTVPVFLLLTQKI